MGDCLELTLELAPNKWPPLQDLPRLFEENLPAMLALPLTSCFGGVRCGPAVAMYACHMHISAMLSRRHGTCVSSCWPGSDCSVDIPVTAPADRVPWALQVTNPGDAVSHD